MNFTIDRSVGQGGVNQPTDVLALKRRLIELGYDWLSNNSSIDSETIAAIKLFQSVVSGRQKVAGDGRVDVPGQTLSWLQAGNAPRWQMMPAGAPESGFVNDELADPNDLHDFGTDWMAHTIEASGRAYLKAYLESNPSASPLRINDVSLQRGGTTPDHKGHQTGLACDIRVPRTDGSGGGTWHGTNNQQASATYDRNAMRAMLTAIGSQLLVTRIFFNDPILIQEGLCVAQAGHHNHAHFEIVPWIREA